MVLEATTHACVLMVASTKNPVHAAPLSPACNTRTLPAPATPPRQARVHPALTPPRPQPGALLHALRTNRSADIAQILDADELESINPISDHSGCETPLLKAARYGCSANILNLLLERGANVDSIGNDQLTPLMIIIQAGDFCSLDFENSLGFSNGSVQQPWLNPPTWPPWSGQVPLSGMAGESALPEGLPRLSEDKCMDLATCLLQSGADALQLDPSGQSAPDVALGLGKPRLAALLRYWYELQTCRLLRTLWRRYDQGHSAVGTALMVPASVRSLLCRFMVPSDLDSAQLALTNAS